MDSPYSWNGTSRGLRQARQAVDFSNILIIWLYVTPVISCLTEITGFEVLQLIRYGVLLTLLVYVVTRPGVKLRCSVIIFFAVATAYALTSVILVSGSNWYAVVVDAVPAFLIWSPCVVVLSQDDFHLSLFCTAWKKASAFLSLFVIVLIPLTQSGIVTYGAISHPATINALGQLVTIALIHCNGDESSSDYKRSLVLFLINAMAVCLFGGRSFALALILSACACWLLTTNMTVSKLLKLVLLLIAILTIFFNLHELLSALQLVLESAGIRSRNLSLLIDQLDSSEIYLSNRDVVYQAAMQILNRSNFMPAGFGAIFAATNGAYYHPHNIFLQLEILFGVPGMLLFVASFIWRMLSAKRLFGGFAQVIALILAAYYIPYSIYNGSILVEPIAILLISILFFMKRDANSEQCSVTNNQNMTLR